MNGHDADQGAARARVSLPPLSGLARVRLWISYQRYAGLLLVGPIAVAIATVVLAPWWLTALTSAGGLVPLRFGLEVAGRWPRKLRATRLAMARIARGRFAPSSVRAYCGDPCFRVVAAEILARAGYDGAQRRRLVAEFRRELRAADRQVVYFDYQNQPLEEPR